MTYKLKHVMPQILPSTYREIITVAATLINWPPGQIKTFIRNDGMKVVISIDDAGPTDGTYLHASVSYEDHLPSWDDLKEVHELLMGDLPAVQMLPSKEYWFSLCEYVLHMWSRLDAPIVPEVLWKNP